MMKSKIIHKTIFYNGGTNSGTVELYQLASGRCRVWCYGLNGDGRMESLTISIFHCKDWKQAIRKGKENTVRIFSRRELDGSVILPH
jgi:hypothetical protein